VAGLGGADEVVVAEPELVEVGLERAGHLVDELLGRLARRLGGAGDLLAVLVGAGEEVRPVAREPVVAGDGVAADGRVDVPDVRLAVGVVDRRRKVERAVGHGSRG